MSSSSRLRPRSNLAPGSVWATPPQRRSVQHRVVAAVDQLLHVRLLAAEPLLAAEAGAAAGFVVGQLFVHMPGDVGRDLPDDLHHRVDAQAEHADR